MLDRFIAGRVTRLSPEAPVPVVMFDHESHRIGGAANVAHNVTALGGRATLVAVAGHDEAAATLAVACRDAGIAPALVGPRRRGWRTRRLASPSPSSVLLSSPPPNCCARSGSSRA